MKYSKIKKIYLIIGLLVSVIFYVKNVKEFVPIEKLDIPIALGYDLASNDSKNPIYDVSIAVYQFLTGNTELNTIVIGGKAGSLAKTREERQTKSNKKFILGSEKVLLISDKVADKSILPLSSILFNNTYANDTARVAIFKGNTKEALNFKIRGYNSAADYIRGMIDTSINYNFFSDHYKMIDVYTRLTGEGRNLVVPYIEIYNGVFKMSGLALFNGERVQYVANIDEARAINVLRQDEVSGIIHMQNEKGENTNLDVLSRRKIKCNREDDKYKFTIDINLEGDIIENDIYKNIINNHKLTKKIEEDFEKIVKKATMQFIEKMQNELKFDCLELGKFAVAKYGRRTNVDWNNIICKSEIKVNVKVNLRRIGRGMLN